MRSQVGILVGLVLVLAGVGCGSDGAAAKPDAGDTPLDASGRSPDAGAAKDAGDTRDANASMSGDAGDASEAHDAGAGADDAGVCSDAALEPGHLLVLFDRSGSMNMAWGAKIRWEIAGSAMIDALTPLQSQLTLGAVLFPSDDLNLVSCSVEPISAAQQVAFQPGAAALTKLQTGGPSAAPLYVASATGQSPLKEAIDAADAALGGTTLSERAAVIIVTDANPNCTWDATAATATIEAWRTSKHIKTYLLVVNDGVIDNMAELDAMAAAGGTKQARIAMDGADLEARIDHIVRSTLAPPVCP